MVGHSVLHTGQRSNDVSGTADAGFLTDNEGTLALEYEVELVLRGVSMDSLFLPRIETVETEHESLTLEQGGLEYFVWA